MAGGRKPNLERWRRVEELRAAGLSLPEIGRCLGITHQAVAAVLRNIRMTRARVRSVACAGCGEPIISAGCLPSDRGKALCLGCLAQRPEAPFGQRLKAFRLAAGLTKAELGSRCGLPSSALCKYEGQGVTPYIAAALRLVEALDVSLKALGLDGRPPAGPARRPRHRSCGRRK